MAADGKQLRDPGKGKERREERKEGPLSLSFGIPQVGAVGLQKGKETVYSPLRPCLCLSRAYCLFDPDTSVRYCAVRAGLRTWSNCRGSIAHAPGTSGGYLDVWGRGRRMVGCLSEKEG